jgi:hypothetical protein
MQSCLIVASRACPCFAPCRVLVYNSGVVDMYSGSARLDKALLIRPGFLQYILIQIYIFLPI